MTHHTDAIVVSRAQLRIVIDALQFVDYKKLSIEEAKRLDQIIELFKFKAR